LVIVRNYRGVTPSLAEAMGRGRSHRLCRAKTN
jgi:hypothetical protein